LRFGKWGEEVSDRGWGFQWDLKSQQKL